MTAARDDDFMALPGMEADSTDTHHARELLSDDATPTSANTSPNASSKSALDALLDEYRARAKSEREKGTLFEELTRQFLLHDARFAHQFKEIYLWSEWPEHRTGDTGIDLVAIPIRDGEGPVAIQCKFYALGHRIQKADIDSSCRRRAKSRSAAASSWTRRARRGGRTRRTRSRASRSRFLASRWRICAIRILIGARIRWGRRRRRRLASARFRRTIRCVRAAR